MSRTTKPKLPSAAASVVNNFAVADLAIFSGVAAAQLDDIFRHARSLQYYKGAAVFEQGAAPDCFFLLLYGHLRVTKVTPDGQQVTIRYVTRGEIFGVAVALGFDAYPATAIAAVDSVVVVWPSAEWQRIAAKHSIFMMNTLQMVGERLHDAHARIVEMSTEKTERRIARALIQFTTRAGRKVDAGILIEIPVSRQDIAEMTGTTLHRVSRVLSAWEQQGVVASGRQRIVVCDSRKLFAMAEGNGGDVPCQKAPPAIQP